MCDKEVIEVKKILPFLSGTCALCQIGRAFIRASPPCQQKNNKSQCPVGLVLVIAVLMHNDFLCKLPQQSRGKFFKACMPPDNIHKLFCVHGGFLRLDSGSSFFQLPLALLHSLPTELHTKIDQHRCWQNRR